MTPTNRGSAIEIPHTLKDKKTLGRREAVIMLDMKHGLHNEVDVTHRGRARFE